VACRAAAGLISSMIFVSSGGRPPRRSASEAMHQGVDQQHVERDPATSPVSRLLESLCTRSSLCQSVRHALALTRNPSQTMSHGRRF